MEQFKQLTPYFSPFILCIPVTPTLLQHSQESNKKVTAWVTCVLVHHPASLPAALHCQS